MTEKSSILKKNHDILNKLGNVKVKVKKDNEKEKYWKLEEIIYNNDGDGLICWLRKGKQRVEHTELLSQNLIINYRGSWFPFESIISLQILRGEVLLKMTSDGNRKNLKRKREVPEPDPDKVPDEDTEKKILKRKRGRKTRVQLQ